MRNFENIDHTFSQLADEYCDVNHLQETDIMFNVGMVSNGHEISRDVIDPSGKKRYLITEHSSLEAERLISSSKIRSALLKRTETTDSYFENLDIFEVSSGARSLYKLFYNTQQKPPVYNPFYMQRLAFRAGSLMRKLYDLDEQCFGLHLSSIIVSHNDDNVTDDITYKISPPLTIFQRDTSSTMQEILQIEEGKYAAYIEQSLTDGFEGTNEQFRRI